MAAALARRPSTIRTYGARLARFLEWCSHKQIRLDSASPARFADVMILLSGEDKQPTTTWIYMSAITDIGTGFPLELLRGMVNRYVHSRHNASTELHLARQLCEPMDTASLRDLTIKKLFLIASVLARMRSCLHALSTVEGHILFNHRDVILVPGPKFQAISSCPNCP